MQIKLNTNINKVDDKSLHLFNLEKFSPVAFSFFVRQKIDSGSIICSQERTISRSENIIFHDSEKHEQHIEN